MLLKHKKLIISLSLTVVLLVLAFVIPICSNHKTYGLEYRIDVTAMTVAASCNRKTTKKIMDIDEIHYGKKVTEIKDYGFCETESIEEVTVSKNVAMIGVRGLADNKNLRQIILLCEQVPALKWNAITNNNSKLKISVPQDKYEDYQLACKDNLFGWNSSLLNKLEIIKTKTSE